MIRDDVTEAIRAMLDESGTRVSFAVELVHEMDWQFKDNVEECVRRCRQYFNPQMYRYLPARAIPVAIRVSGRDLVSPILRRELTHAEDRIAAGPSPSAPGWWRAGGSG